MIKAVAAIGIIVFGPVFFLGLISVIDGGGESLNPADASFVVPRLSAEAATGQALFADACGTCHGAYGEGTMTGPPLLHPLYAPDRLDSSAFHRAVQDGVAAYRWPLGDMAPVAGLEVAEIDRLYRFMREMQRANGID